MHIKLLDEKTKNLIAAGEVIERPASVVKELVENSLDAGARRIVVELEGAGNRLIRVMDDGTGMDRQDAELSFCRHATSKISSAEDLNNISTLGFRGEALPSVAAVSRFELETSTRDSTCGTMVIVEGGKTLETSDTSRAPGTTSTVRNLFFNVPARRKFLKSEGTELRHCVKAVTSLAIAQIETSFKLIHDGREIFSVAQTGSLEERVEDIFGNKLSGKQLPVFFEHGDCLVGGLIARPDSVTGARAEQYIFLNRRPIQCRSLIHAVRQGYQSTIPDSAQPSFFIFLTMDPHNVDINVHPSKLEVRFRDEGFVFSIVHRAVQEGLRQEGAIAELKEIQSGKLVSFGPGTKLSPAAAKIKGRIKDSAALAGLKKGGLQTSFLMPLEPSAPGINKPGTGLAGNTSSLVQTEGATRKPAFDFPGIELAEQALVPSLWQLHGRYIFLETKTGCLIIDQHAAHERVIYEKIMAEMAGGSISKQRLLFPVTLQLDSEEYLAAIEFKALLEQGGFQIEEFGGRTVIVRTVPSLPDLGGLEDYFRNLLRDLAKEGQGSTGTRHQVLARSLACRAAIKSGKRLTAREMSDLVDQLFATELPYADVHGRNTIVQLTTEEIDKRFGRS
jgi:DNA mismatch repair protein MutL